MTRFHLTEREFRILAAIAGAATGWYAGGILGILVGGFAGNLLASTKIHEGRR